MENPKERAWTYPTLRNRIHETALHWQDRLRGLPLFLSCLDDLEALLLWLVDNIERLERLTYPTRWERIEDDSINPLG